MVSSQGGGEIEAPLEPSRANPADVAVHPGYRIEVVATDLTYPSGITFDGQGRPVVVESGFDYSGDQITARLVRLDGGDKRTVIAEGKNVPWDGVHYHDGAFYIAEGGNIEGGRIVRIAEDGSRKVLVEGLPSLGDHQTNGPVVSDDGWVYFGQGTVTNSGVVGEDNHQMGWLAKHPEAHDVPCKDVKLSGQNFESDNPLTPDEDDEVVTGPFMPFGTPSSAGQVIKGQVPCSGAIMRVRTDGGPVELVAWGLRNPFGLRFAPDGKLYATDNGYDDRGSRAVFGNADWLWEIKPGAFYGWPDYADGRPLQDHNGDNRYSPVGEPDLKMLLVDLADKPEQPSAFFGVHSSATGLDFSKNPKFGFVGQAFVALFGDMAGNTGKVLNPVGFKVMRVDVSSGVMYDFAANKGKRNEPASKAKTGGLERPVDVKFDPTGEQLYVVDYGTLSVDDDVVKGYRRTGRVWRIVPENRK